MKYTWRPKEPFRIVFMSTRERFCTFHNRLLPRGDEAAGGQTQGRMMAAREEAGEMDMVLAGRNWEDEKRQVQRRHVGLSSNSGKATA